MAETFCVREDNLSHGPDIQSRTVSFLMSILQSSPGWMDTSSDTKSITESFRVLN